MITNPLFKKCISILGICFFISFNFNAQAPPIQWTKQMQGLYDTYPMAMTTDKQGNLYTAISFAQKMSIGTQSLAGGGYRDFCIYKTKPSGHYLWNKIITGGTYHMVSGMVCDANGNLYLSGSFSGVATFGNITLYCSGGYDGFIMKMNGKGDVLWAYNVGGTGNDGASGIVLSPSGYLYVSGGFEIDFDFGGALMQSNGLSDAFVIKADTANGSVVWATQLGGTYDEGASTIAVAANERLFISGTFSVSTTLGNDNFNAVSARDLFLCSLEPTAGNVVWAQHMASTGYDESLGLVVDTHGDVYSLGNFGGTFTSGSTTFSTQGFVNIFYAKNNGTSGTLEFARMFNSLGSFRRAGCLAINGTDNIYMTGYFDNMFTIGTETFYPGGGADIFLTEMDTLGNFQWADQKGGLSNDIPFSLTADAFGNIYTGGVFTENMDYGSSQFSVPTGSVGGFMAKWGTEGPFTSIADLDEEEFPLSIFPNPFSDKFIVKMEESDKPATVSISDVLGKIIFSSVVKDFEVELSLAEFKPGVYNLMITQKDGVSVAKKIIRE
ncbi:hypothetical protein CNR22_09095 [Sphingobacteriaceae bacterium]|nr:hypothetical protein CNR22_09095 [Sphingobacteriaceae bacterium]